MWGEKTNESVVKFLKELYDRGKSEDEVVLNVFSVVLGASVEYAQGVLGLSCCDTKELTWCCLAGLVHVINFYMDKKNTEHKKQMCELAHVNRKDVDALFEGYVREALRMLHCRLIAC